MPIGGAAHRATVGAAAVLGCAGPTQTGRRLQTPRQEIVELCARAVAPGLRAPGRSTGHLPIGMGAAVVPANRAHATRRNGGFVRVLGRDPRFHLGVPIPRMGSRAPVDLAGDLLVFHLGVPVGTALAHPGGWPGLALFLASLPLAATLTPRPCPCLALGLRVPRPGVCAPVDAALDLPIAEFELGLVADRTQPGRRLLRSRLLQLRELGRGFPGPGTIALRIAARDFRSAQTGEQAGLEGAATTAAPAPRFSGLTQGAQYRRAWRTP